MNHKGAAVVFVISEDHLQIIARGGLATHQVTAVANVFGERRSSLRDYELGFRPVDAVLGNMVEVPSVPFEFHRKYSRQVNYITNLSVISMARQEFLERMGEGGFDGGHGGRSFGEEFLHGGDGAGEAAGVDEGKEGEVGGDIEGDAVEGDPAAEFDAEGADFGERRGKD